MNKKLASHIIGPDGYERDRDFEHKLNSAVFEVSRTPAGERLFSYLKMLVNRVHGPDGIDPHKVVHLDGQRFLAGVLLQRAELGKEGLPKLTIEQEKDK